MRIWKNKKNNANILCEISIIVPVYQSEIYIGRCLKSLIKQNFDKYEIICVDDGSTDNSSGIIHDFVENNEKIHYIYQANKGVSAARNLGLKKAKGKYIMFVDSDDFIKPYVLKKLYTSAEENSADMVVFGGRMDRAWRAPEWMRMAFYSRNKKYSTFSFDMLFNEPGCLPSVCNKLIASRCIKDKSFLENIHIAEDMTFLCTLFPTISKIVFLSKPIYKYRISNEYSAMHNTSNSRIDYMGNHVMAAGEILREWKEFGFINGQLKGKISEWITSFLRAPYKFLESDEKITFRNQIDFLYQMLGSDNLLLEPENKFEGKRTILGYASIFKRDILRYGVRGGIENLVYKIFFRS